MSFAVVTDGSAARPVTKPPEPHRRFGDSSRGLEDLGPRLLMAGILIPSAIVAVMVGGAWLAAACAAAAVAMSFEWARMSAPDAVWQRFAVTAIAATGAIGAASWSFVGFALGWLGFCAFVAGVLSDRRAAARAEAAFGVIYIGLPVSAFLWLREDTVGGAPLLLGLLYCVWAADGAAYFGGRLIGGPKLHRGVSPNKTWAGVLVGSAAGAAAGAGCASLFGAPLWLWVAAGGAIGVASMVGDLFESLVKRRFGVKDASGFIPGHGGVLDRLDGLMAASILAAGGVLVAPGLVPILSGAW